MINVSNFLKKFHVQLNRIILYQYRQLPQVRTLWIFFKLKAKLLLLFIFYTNYIKKNIRINLFFYTKLYEFLSHGIFLNISIN